MKKVIAAIDKKTRRIVVEYEGFSGDTCYEEAVRIAAVLKEFGVEIEIQEIQPKRDATVVQSETQTVREG